ncbi:uncharacterized protein HKW66_Vig0218450 [Vigna angularis]|uniref:Uncharacterized protein n=1 Tax=Phaseolus angularis TaxID=3914 RepID=A0A8T0JHE9_PHAAN|nr:uncharacterized protein HKW66_Vig0218450 [Vigna angularis]
MWRRQGGDKRGPVSNVLKRIRCEESLVCGGLCNGEGERVSMKIRDVREVELWWNDEIGGKGEEVFERKGKRLFEGNGEETQRRRCDEQCENITMERRRK